MDRNEKQKKKMDQLMDYTASTKESKKASTKESTKASKYAIKAIHTEKHGIPQRAVQKSGILPKHPFSMVISGSSGSGKTCCMMNILTEPVMLKDYFHYIIVFSPTANTTDDTYKILRLPEENFRDTFEESDLEELIEARKELIKKKGIAWVGKNSRVLIIMDDIIANRSFLNGPSALKIFTLLRHYHCSIMTLVQRYNKLPPALRTNANSTIVFPSVQNEVDVLLDEITPAGIKKREFEKVIDHCTEDKHSFLYINRHADRKEQIRKNLDEIINLDEYKNK
jgi:Cdc6-like AAA superfamily ATPase